MTRRLRTGRTKALALGSRILTALLRLATALLLSLSPVRPLAAQSTDVSLELDSKKLEGGSEFQFLTQSSAQENSLPFSLQDDAVRAANTPVYSLAINLNTIHLDKYQTYFHYDFYVFPKASPSAITHFFVIGKPIGPFPDRMADVSFRVGPSSSAEAGSITLPVVSTAGEAVLVPPEFPKAQDIPLSGTGVVILRLENRLTNLPLTIRNTSAAVPHNSYWQVVELHNGTPRNAGELVLTPQGVSEGKLTLYLVPKTFSAVAASFLPLSARPSHDTIAVTLDCATLGGAIHSVPFNVPIRFSPWGPTLFLAAAVGALLGSVIPPLTVTGRAWSAWPRALAVAVLFALLAEGIALLLASAGSQVRLVGVDLDPYQLLPAAVIGCIVGVTGFKTADKFPTLFGTR